MKLIVGLGNPGKKYVKTRHNIGFFFADKLREFWNFPEFKLEKNFKSEISRKKLEIGNWKLEIMLVKPQTFMNNSGTAVKKIMDFYKLAPADIIVIHDDLDIELGKFKISEDSRAAGHNGVESIINSLGTQKFKRVRIGIEGPVLRQKRKIPGDKFVLKNFTSSESKTIQKTSGEIISSIQNLLP